MPQQGQRGQLAQSLIWETQLHNVIMVRNAESRVISDHCHSFCLSTPRWQMAVQMHTNIAVRLQSVCSHVFVSCVYLHCVCHVQLWFKVALHCVWVCVWVGVLGVRDQRSKVAEVVWVVDFPSVLSLSFFVPLSVSLKTPQVSETNLFITEGLTKCPH